MRCTLLPLAGSRPLTWSSSGLSLVSINTFSLSKKSTSGSVTSPCTSSSRPACGAGRGMVWGQGQYRGEGSIEDSVQAAAGARKAAMVERRRGRAEMGGAEQWGVQDARVVVA